MIILNSVSSLQSLWTKINELVKAFYNEIKSFSKENSNLNELDDMYLETANKVFSKTSQMISQSPRPAK